MTEADLTQLPAPPSRLYPLRYRKVQARLKKSKARFKTVPAGRRSGKTELLKRRLVEACILAHTYPDENYGACAPTRDQAKAIYWDDLKRMVPPELLRGEPRESDLAIPFITGATLFVIGLDKPQRIEGRPWDGLGIDEIANTKGGAWGENIRPALSDRKGWAWLIGVPEGRNHYYDLNQYALSGVDPEWESFTWPSSDILPASEIAAAKRQLDPLTFQQEYEASFINFVGRAYYPFVQSTHAVKRLTYNDRADLGFCFDFNVDPGVCGIVQEQQMPGQYERSENGLLDLSQPIFGTGVIGEVHIPQNSNTPAVCRKLIKDWGEHQGRVICYGDSTGGARGTAQTEGSDWDLIKAALRPVFGDRLSFDVPLANPAERARVNAVNSRLQAGDGTIRLMIDPAAAPQTVKDFEGVRMLVGGSGEIDKKATPALTHVSDGIGYYVARRYPLVVRAIRPSTFRM